MNLEQITNHVTKMPSDPIEIKTTSRGLGYLTWLLILFGSGAASWVFNVFTKEDAAKLSQEIYKDIREIREHAIVQDQQLVEIAKTVGARILIEIPASQQTGNK